MFGAIVHADPDCVNLRCARPLASHMKAGWLYPIRGSLLCQQSVCNGGFGFRILWHIIQVIAGTKPFGKRLAGQSARE